MYAPSIIPVMDDDRTLRDFRGTETIADSRRDGKGNREREGRERETDERDIREAYF